MFHSNNAYITELHTSSAQLQMAESKKHRFETDNDTLIHIEVKATKTVAVRIDSRFEDFTCVLLLITTKQL